MGYTKTVDIAWLLICNIDLAILSQFLFFEELYIVASLASSDLTVAHNPKVCSKIFLLMKSICSSWIYTNYTNGRKWRLNYLFWKVKIKVKVKMEIIIVARKTIQCPAQCCIRSRVDRSRSSNVFQLSASSLTLCVLCSQSPRFWRNVQSLLSIMEWWTGSTGCLGSPPTSSVSGMKKDWIRKLDVAFSSYLLDQGFLSTDWKGRLRLSLPKLHSRSWAP